MNNFGLTKTPFRRPRRYEFTDGLNVKIRLTDKKLWPWKVQTTVFYQRHDDIWVVVDRLTKSTHFLPIREKFYPQKLAELFMNHIVSLHGVLVSIISDRDPRFTLRFWKGLMKELGVKLNLSTAFHP